MVGGGGNQLTAGYGGFGYGNQLNSGYGTAGGALATAEKRLATARGNCAKWQAEYERRVQRDAGFAAAPKLARLSPIWIARVNTAKMTKPVGGARKKVAKFCALVKALEASLDRMRGDVAASNPVFTDPTVAAQAALAMGTGGPSPMLMGGGIFGLILLLGGGLLFALSRRKRKKK